MFKSGNKLCPRRAVNRSGGVASPREGRVRATKNKYLQWSPVEEAALIAGVKKHRKSSMVWSSIKKDPAFKYDLRKRTNVNLKDKWREEKFREIVFDSPDRDNAAAYFEVFPPGLSDDEEGDSDDEEVETESDEAIKGCYREQGGREGGNHDDDDDDDDDEEEEEEEEEEELPEREENTRKDTVAALLADIKAGREEFRQKMKDSMDAFCQEEDIKLENILHIVDLM